MKNVIRFSLLALVLSFFAAPAAMAVPSYLYYHVSAYDPVEWQYFALARIGVTSDGGETVTYLQNMFDNGDGTYGTADYIESDLETSSSAYGWAEILDEYANKNYWFFVETIKEDGSAGWGYNEETAVNYADLSSHIVGDIKDIGSAGVTPWDVPEPSSALLLLLGLAGLGLRRRAGTVPRIRPADWRSVLTLSLSLSIFSFAFGSIDDTLISFSTEGPDKYLDGTTVKDGECYALVWTKTGATFEGLAANGVAVGTNSQVIVFAPVAKDGHCPPVLFELDAALAEQFKNGSYGVYLLDTRLASGAVGGVNAQGAPVAVNGWGEIKRETEASADVHASAVAVTTKSEVPSDAPQPKITAIRLVGNNVFLTVKNTLPCLQYAAKGVEKLGEGEALASYPVQGAAATDGEITIIAPKKGNSGFFSVSRK